MDERDVVLTHSLMKAANCASLPYGPPVKVVGVVGMGHIPGIKDHWMSDECRNISDLLVIPPPHISTVIFWGYVRWIAQALFTFGLYWTGCHGYSFIYRKLSFVYHFMKNVFV